MFIYLKKLVRQAEQESDFEQNYFYHMPFSMGK